jgi:hypothetical protein
MPLKTLFEAEIKQMIDKRSKQETEAGEGIEVVEKMEEAVEEMEAVEETERRRAKEISVGRQEIISGNKRPDKESIHPGLPVYIRTPRMIVTGKSAPTFKRYPIY